MTAWALLLGIAATPLEVSDDLSQRYARWDKAYLNHDVKLLASLLHPRMRIVTGSGKVIPRGAYLRSLWQAQAPAFYRTTVLSASRKGDRAVALTQEVSQQQGAKRHEHRYRDRWVLRQGHWLLLESKTLEEK